MSDFFKPFSDTVDTPHSGHDFALWEAKQLASDETQVEMISEGALEEIKQAAHQEGLKQGMQAATAEIEQQQADLAHLMSIFVEPLQIIDASVQNEMVDLVVTICKACLHSELSNDPKKILGIFEEIKQLMPANSLKPELYLSPEDARLMRVVVGIADSKLSQEHIIDDESLSRGEYRLSTQSAEIDGKIATRLKQLVQSVFEADVEHHDE